MSAIIGSLGIFDYRNQEWCVFYGRLKLFIKLNDIEAEKQSAVLLTSFSDDSYRLVSNLLHPKKVEEATFDELVKILNSHFTPKRSTFADRSKFYEAVKLDNENAEEWAARLRGLAVHCEFGQELEVLLRDRFVLGFRSGPERDRLCEQDISSLTLAKALEIAQQAACARQARASETSPAVIVKEEPLYKTNANRAGGSGGGGGARRRDEQKTCTVCGLKNHVAEKCRFKNYRCNKCNNKGHLKKVCELKINNIESQSVSSPPCMTASEDNQECEECQLLSSRCVNGDPILLSVKIDGCYFDMELDSGSSTSVISDKFHADHFSKYPLFTNCNVKMCFYNGHKISPVGYFTVPVIYGNQIKSISFYVIKDGGAPLLGRDFMANFGICFVVNNNKIGTSENSELIDSLLCKYKELFNGELGCYKGLEVKLQLKQNVNPKFCKARPIPFAIKERVEAELDRLVSKGILVPVNHSDYAAPIVPVLKPNGSVRVCADYSISLNNDIIVDKYPLPRIEDVFVKLSGGQQFSKLDCSQAYNQLLLSPDSQKLTTINTTKGLFMYTRLVFGLASAPAIFQRAIENLLAGIEGVTVFLDDVCITGPNREIHLERLEKVFQRFKNAGLKLEKDKCALFQDRITYLGHIIDKNGLHKCTSKIEAILKAPTPTNVRELKRFLGMVNYYRNFVPNASSIMNPLHELLRGGARWEWTERQQAAFERAKSELTSSRVLAHFDPSAQLVLAVDASPDGLGAVLSQVGHDGVERPLAFGSRTLTSSERNYSQLQKEATAIVFGVKRFHQYLYGRHDPFILKTDHRPLLAIFGKKNGISPMTAGRLVRYAIFLSGYNYKIMYTKGKENQVADYFSRAVTPSNIEPKVNNIHSHSINALQLTSLPITYVHIREATSSDKELAVVSKYVMNGWPRKNKCLDILPYYLCRNELELENGCLLRGHRVVIPEMYRGRLLSELHKSHQGIVRTKSAARALMWWPGIDKQVEQLIAACSVCSALRCAPPRAPPAPWPRTAGPWERIHIDYMSINQRSYLVVVDSWSKWVECLDMGGNLTTKHLIKQLKTLFSRFGLPQLIVSDNDRKIASQEFLEFCQINGINYFTSPIYHPNSNGQAENSVRNCKKMIKSIMANNSCISEINEKLLDYLFQYRNTPHCSTGESPAKLMLGRQLRSILDMIKPPVQVDNKIILEPNESEKVRLFSEGQNVWVKCFDHKKSGWHKGKIVNKIGNRLYEVLLLDENIKIKRHVDQLFRRVDDDHYNCTEPYLGEELLAQHSSDNTSSPSTHHDLSLDGIVQDTEQVDDMWHEAVEDEVLEEEVESSSTERGCSVEDVVEEEVVGVNQPNDMQPIPESPPLLQRLRPRNKNINYKL